MRTLAKLLGGLALLVLPALALAAVVPAQNQVILPPFGSNGFVVSTSSVTTDKLSATSTPYFANFFANNGTIKNLNLTSLAGLVGAGTNGATYSVATTTASCSGGTSCSSFTVIGSSPVTITSSGSANSLGTTSPWTIGNIAMVSSNANVTSVGTSTPTISSGLSYSGTFGNVIGGVSGNLTCNTANATTFGCLSAADWLTFNGKVATGTNFVSSNVAYFGSNGTLYNIATGTASGSNGVTVTAGRSVLGGALTIDCTASSRTATGCLSATDYNTFANKIGTSSALTAGQVLYATTNSIGNTVAGTATGTVAASTGISVTAGQSVIGSGLTITNTGVISASCSGGTTCSGTNPLTINSFSYLFPANATTTSLGLYASTTIGAGATTTGLTISGGATTTGTGYFAGQVGIGTSSPFTGALIIDSAGLSTNTYITGSRNGFIEVNIQNRNSGSSASGDFVSTADNGTPTTHYVDLGINGSSGGGQPFTSANNAYLYSVDDTLNIGALGASAVITFNTTGGVSSPAERGRFDSSGRFGVGTSTPNWLVQAAATRPSLALSDTSAGANLKHWLLSSMGGNLYIGTSTDAFATSTLAALTILNNGQVSTTELRVATSTAMTVDWNTTPNQVLVQIGGSAMTIGFNNASTSGMTKRILICNSDASASTVTWSINNSSTALLWPAGTAPTQTTTAKKCDIYSFIVSQATSTAVTTVKILGAQTANF